MIRKDLRGWDQTRKIGITLGGVLEADGAARFSLGDTSVLATVSGPAQPRYSRHEDAEKGKIEVEVNMARESGVNSNELVVAEYIRNTLTNCVKLEAFPRLLIVVKVLVVRNDGSVLSASVNACILALLDAGIPMNQFATCIEFGFVSNQQLLDPTSQEEQQSEANVSVAIASNWRQDNIISATESKIIALEVQGNLTGSDLAATLDNAEKFACSLGITFRKAIENKIIHSNNSLIS
jgi:ribonuclease PH